MKSLIFVENFQQVQYCLEHLKMDAEISLFLSLHPRASYYMEKKGIKYSSCEQYYTEKELNDHFLKDLRRVQRLCRFIDTEVKNLISFFKEESINFGTISWYPLKNLMNSYSSRVFIIDKVLQAERLSKVYFFENANIDYKIKMNNFTSLVPHNNISLWSEVIPLVCRCLEINVISIKQKDIFVEPYIDKKGIDIKGMVRNLSKYKWMSAIINMVFNIKEYFINFGIDRNVPALVFLSLDYQTKYLWKYEKKQRNFKLYHFRKKDKYLSSVHRDELKILADKILENIELQNMFQTEVINYFSLLEPIIHRYFTDYVLTIWNYYESGKKYLQWKKARAIIVSTAADIITRAVAEAAKSLNIPVVVYRHGFTQGHVSMESHMAHPVHYCDVKVADYFLVGGEGDCDYVNKHAQGETMPIAVGLLSLEQLKKIYMEDIKNGKREKICLSMGINPEKRVFMYVPTSWDGNVTPGPFRNRSPELMFQVERSIVDIFIRHPEHYLIFKLYPPHLFSPISPIVEYVKDKNPMNIKFSLEAFANVMAGADVFIADYPATTLFEMLLTKKPILFCGYELPWQFTKGKWDYNTVSMWKNRILYKEDLTGFIKMLESFKEEGEYDKEWENKEMLEQFGIFKDDGMSGERCHEFLVRLVNER